MDAERPYGSWSSPVTPELIVASSVSLGEVRVDGGGADAPVWWSELRPTEGGRVQVVRRDAAGRTTDVLPEGYGARTRVHEYGGGAWWLHEGTLFFANWDDQRLWRLEPGDSAPVALTRPPLEPHGLRYADGCVTGDGRWVVCVRESHEHGGEPVNELVAVPTGGGDALGLGTDADFVSNPRLSPDGRWLAWLEWDHPDMPWDATRLWVAEVHADDHELSVEGARVVAGGTEEAITQPEWSPEGVLHFLSDRSGWSNLYRFAAVGNPDPGDRGSSLVSMEADVGTPPWVFAMSRYAFLDGEAVVVACSTEGRDELRIIESAPAPGGVRVRRLACEHTSFASCRSWGGELVAVVASPTSEAVVAAIGFSDRPEARTSVLRPARDLGVDPQWWSVPRHITFATGPVDPRREDHGDEAPSERAPSDDARADGARADDTGSDRSGPVAHGLYYAPTNPEHVGPDGTRPPLLVAIHGGPTSAARPQLQLGIQFWTTRGFGVLDVNYRGSTGYGRHYRRLLDGVWGVADVQDCAAGAAHLAAEGAVDGTRLAIHGGSAGGFTTLMALITTDRFAAGTSSYGVTDLEALARDTHKFESRYLDRLVGPYPQERQRYRERSPVHHLDQLRSPVLLLQGVEDQIVPMSQAELMVAALRRNRVPFAFLAFEGEQHGFRRAETIRRALTAELVFYARVLGFEVDEDLMRDDQMVTTDLEIENLTEGGQR
jgi:dipeptidyl aminopeptidase/acylaminoacyl peptidase